MMDVCEAKLKAGVCQTVSNGLASTTGWPSFNLWQLHLSPTSCNWAHPGFHNMDNPGSLLQPHNITDLTYVLANCPSFKLWQLPGPVV